MYDYIYLFFLIVCSVLYIIGNRYNSLLLKFGSGAGILSFGIYMMVNGIEGYPIASFGSGEEGVWVLLVAFILIGLGLYVSIVSAYDGIGGEE